MNHSVILVISKEGKKRRVCSTRYGIGMLYHVAKVMYVRGGYKVWHCMHPRPSERKFERVDPHPRHLRSVDSAKATRVSSL